MNEKNKKLIESYIHSIQAQCELVLFHLEQVNEKDQEPKGKKEKKKEFTGTKGVCDKQCDDKDIINLSTFGGKKGFQCKRCGLKVENK